MSYHKRFMFSPGSDIISAPPGASHYVNCVQGGNNFNVTSSGDIGNVAVMAMSGDFATTSQPRQEIAKEYIRTHGDNFDFLVFLSTFDYTLPNGAQGLYTPVKNDTHGINRSQFDYTTQFGSSGKLQGTIDLGNVTSLAAAPFGPKLDQTLTPVVTTGEFTTSLTVEGTYTFTASAVGPNEQTYSDSVTITAMSKTKLDNLLQAKWNGMRAVLTAGNVEGAVSFFMETSQASFRQQFTTLSVSLPEIADELSFIRMVKARGAQAEYDLRKVINGTTYSFLVQMVKDKDGIWRIRTF